jgi:hypothetical protein
MNEEIIGNRISTADMLATAGKLEKLKDLDDEEKLQERAQSGQIDEIEPLFNHKNIEVYRSRWQDIQARFVDDPKDSVRDADELVAKVIQNIAEIFAGERSYLEEMWKQGGEVSTEDLRLSLTRYRSFFNRLLSIGR